MGLRVLIVEDMATYRTIIARSLAEIPDVEVVGKASNGRKALAFLDEHPVDLITLDVEMPVMDGLATLKELRRRGNATDVVMLSGLSDQAAQLTIQCLELGAIDFVLKPQTASFVQNQTQLVVNLTRIIDNLTRKRSGRAPRTVPKTVEAPKPTPRPRVIPKKTPLLMRPKIVMIGVSTGGPKALSEVFGMFEKTLPFSILVVQHMPAMFTRSLAGSLNRKGAVRVVEATDGDVIEANTAYIAPGGYHMALESEADFGLVLAMNQDPPVNSCRPSVDVLFESAVPLFRPGEVVAVIMTGMGRDGADGCVALSRAGACVATQSEETCTIYGMPKSVEDLGIANETLDLREIAPFIQRMANLSPARFG